MADKDVQSKGSHAFCPGGKLLVSETIVAQALHDLISTCRRSRLFPTYDPEASQLVGTNPYAFALALSLNRKTPVKRIWMIPFDLRQELGHLDPKKISRMSLEELDSVFQNLPHKPLFVNAAPRTVKELSMLVVDNFGGDAAQIWKNKSATEVKKTLQQIHGVGPQIATLSVLLLEQRYGIQFEDHDNMDIKADTHTCRVLYRLGVAQDDTPEAAIAAARHLNPRYPGELDAPLWVIGRNWCHSSAPKCSICPLRHVCEYVGI